MAHSPLEECVLVALDCVRSNERTVAEMKKIKRKKEKHLLFILDKCRSVLSLTSCSLVYCSWKGILLSSPSMVAEMFSLMCPDTSCSFLERFSEKGKKLIQHVKYQLSLPGSTLTTPSLSHPHSCTDRSDSPSLYQTSWGGPTLLTSMIFSPRKTFPSFVSL